VPNHIVTFQSLHTSTVLTVSELDLLELLNKYHLTLVEQFYLDYMAPELNGEEWANASSPNAGATGMIRDDEFKDNLSSQFIGRKTSEATKDKIRKQRLGTKASDATRAKMSMSQGGTLAFVMDVDSSVVKTYVLKSDAAKALSISVRTLGR
jgi:hypothetical protein